ncbi:uncharacterized protein LOC114354567 isoform X2 [Ostrinia furnacalis]|uniref:uncharacterized protein LOC114354567 isoform X1 n=1 Tax=Ostrinia furnacalis TaxID=93504 RepID=UPI00103F429F|nr:uncharacterized protein LOC114354567 isoform X1 [Ostrinia furnacalis]XP_028162799.1 uncharacterized protein LOC114354567 isoform X2 [Ostrinia furnacalis]
MEKKHKSDMKEAEQGGRGHQAKVTPPGIFSFVPEEWPKYKTRFMRYMSLTGQNNNADEEKINCLIYCMGERAEDVILQFGEDAMCYLNLLKKFDDFFAPKRNVIYERFKFNARVQLQGERVDEFVTEIHRLAEHCEYGVLKTDLIRDRIVVGIADKSLSDRMLLKPDLTLEEAIQMGRQSEIQQEETKKMRGEVTELMKIEKRKNTGNCWFCGKERHPREKCPAEKATCYNCKRVGHFAKLCRSKAVKIIKEDSNEYEEQI